MNANIFLKATQIIKNCDTAYLAVLDESGSPHVSTVSAIKPDGIFEVFFATGLNANKTRRILADKRASVCFRSENDNITLVGEAEILTDAETKSRCWLDWFINHFPSGKTDPNYCIIKFKTKRVSLWVDRESAEFTIGELLKIQSRCGLLCGWCTYKQSHSCGGCIETKGNPFHGECPVAKCAQDKGHTHCGECGNLPKHCGDSDCKKSDKNGFFDCNVCGETTCGKLHAYSYKDPNHGDSPAGARVEVCKVWAGKQNNC